MDIPKYDCVVTKSDIPQLTMKGKFITWTIFDHPKDYPNHYVARAWWRGKPTTFIILEHEIETLREYFKYYYMTCIKRDLNDDKVIVETWL